MPSMMFSIFYRRAIVPLHGKLTSFRTLHGLEKSIRSYFTGVGVERLSIRSTTADDYGRVVAIRSDINRGCDYIPGTYLQLLKHNTGYGGFINNDLVSFQFAAVIDNGRSLVMQSGRVKQEYEGRGIISEMKKHCFMNLPRTAIRSVTVTSSPTAYDRLLRKKAHLLCKRGRSIFSISRQSLGVAQRSTEVHPSSLKLADAAYLRDLFLSPKTTSPVFPGNRMVIRGTPYELTTSNIDRILCLSDQILVSKEDGNLISAGSTWRCNHTSVVYLDLFGEAVDEKTICDHVDQHVAGMSSSCEDKIVMYVTYAMQEHTETVRRVLEKRSWKFLVTHRLFAIEEPLCKYESDLTHT